MRALALWVHGHLDPSESLLELLFGLVMAFTMTAGARLLSAPSEIAAGELAVALLGCNVAWGVIDGALYLLGTLFNRNRRTMGPVAADPFPEPAANAYDAVDRNKSVRVA